MNTRQTAWVMVSLLLVFVIGLWLLVRFPSSQFYPATLLVGCLLLTLFLTVERQTRQLKISLNLLPCRPLWILGSLLFALGFWWFDTQLMGFLDLQDQNDQIREWRTLIQDYPLWTVWLGTVLMTPVFEELLFRGMLLNWLRQISSTWPAVAITAVLFSLIHYNWPEAISLFLVGCAYAIFTIRANSVLPALMAHITHNALTFWQHVFV